jgi:lipopolysaccharide/colanic/teichoic acid biosynthesis glycosyltransferase
MRALAAPGFQLLVGLPITVLLPPVLRWGGDIANPSLVGLVESIIGTAICFVIGTTVLRRLNVHPGVDSNVLVILIFTILYAALIAAIFFLRIDFSRYQILAAFFLSVAWSYGCNYAIRRMRRWRIAIVPVGRTDDLPTTRWVIWQRLDNPNKIPRGYDAIVADLHSRMPPNWERFLADCALSRLPVYHITQIIESLTGRVQIDRLSENDLGSLSPSFIYEKVKRLADIVFLAAVTPVVIPLAVIISIVISIDSSGPVLFRQPRIGFCGKRFVLLKFRTMRIDRRGPSYTEDSDSRITRVGRFLRTYRLDELPQIVNILRGEMSWIGPRPESIELANWYERELPFFRYRHVVRPGITGWAQVNQGHVAGIKDSRFKIHYDFYYIKHLSPWLDLLIAFKTLPVVIRGIGAR